MGDSAIGVRVNAEAGVVSLVGVGSVLFSIVKLLDWVVGVVSLVCVDSVLFSIVKLLD